MHGMGRRPVVVRRNTLGGEGSYFARRAREEREAAEQAKSERAALSHRELARRYQELADLEEETARFMESWGEGPEPGEAQRSADIEVLARMAARLAGRDPDEHLILSLGKVPAFDDLLWRYPDFLARAEAAYSLLKDPARPA